MAGTRLSDAELNELTGVSVPEEMTPGKAVISALRDALGYAAGSDALMQISNKEALRQVAKAAAEGVKYRKENLADFKYTLKDKKLAGLAAIREVKGAPEGVFDKISKIEFSPTLNSAAYMQSGLPRGQGKGYVLMGPRRIDPEALRHETAHSWQREYAHPGFAAASQEADRARRYIEYTFGIPEIVEDKMSQYIGEPWRGYHSLAPTEMNAESMEKVPFWRFDTADKYVDTLGKDLLGKQGIGMERARAELRFKKQTAPDVLTWRKVSE
jgi:hypothetical protein